MVAIRGQIMKIDHYIFETPHIQGIDICYVKATLQLEEGQEGYRDCLDVDAMWKGTYLARAMKVFGPSSMANDDTSRYLQVELFLDSDFTAQIDPRRAGMVPS